MLKPRHGGLAGYPARPLAAGRLGAARGERRRVRKSVPIVRRLTSAPPEGWELPKLSSKISSLLFDIYSDSDAMVTSPQQSDGLIIRRDSVDYEKNAASCGGSQHSQQIGSVSNFARRHQPSGS